MLILCSLLEKQEILYEDILKAGGGIDGKLTEQVLSRMSYLKACQQESARIAPVFFGTARTTQQNIVIRGYQELYPFV